MHRRGPVRALHLAPLLTLLQLLQGELQFLDPYFYRLRCFLHAFLRLRMRTVVRGWHSAYRFFTNAPETAERY